MKSLLILVALAFGFNFNCDAMEDHLNEFFVKIRDLKRPIEIYDIKQYRDGGTIAVIIQDKNNDILEFCLNRNYRFPIGRIYVNDTIADSEKAKIVARGDLLEKLLLEVLKEWLSYNNNELEYNKQWEKRKMALGRSWSPEVWQAHVYRIEKIVESMESPTPEKIDLSGAIPYKENKKLIKQMNKKMKEKDKNK